MAVTEETGSEFEARALAVARAIHDPMGTQGSVMYGGRERDAVFISDSAVNYFEFTTLRTKDKAVHDAQKIRDLLVSLKREPENQFKSFTGWFVTRDEPTADQRKAVSEVSKGHQFPIYAISIAALQNRLCNSEEYLAARGRAPFGSIAYGVQQRKIDAKVEVHFEDETGKSVSIDDLVEDLLDGKSKALVGEFGVGKSHAMRELYYELRRLHFKKRKLTPFPVLVNLRDCMGLRSPAEILRRHAEEIGFSNERALISAWRGGACLLLLDGFDEIVPARWLGSAADLKAVRWQALSPVRRLIQEAPSGTGIIVCGRPHYFSSNDEMVDALGLNGTNSILSLHDFNQDQIEAYLAANNIAGKIPEWIPARPLLIGYLIAMGSFDGLESEGSTRSEAWRELLLSICHRESHIFTAVRPEIIHLIIARLATMARSNGDENGPVTMAMMHKAFAEVNGREADAEGVQLLMRLPGFAVAEDSDHEEQRVFVDRNLAETAYGEDLARYLINPYEGHPLSRIASWVSAASDLGVEVAAAALTEHHAASSQVLAAATRRQDNHQYDAVLADSLRVASDMGIDSRHFGKAFLIEGVIFPFLSISGDDPVFANTIFSDCVIEVMDLSLVAQGDSFPDFKQTLIGYVEGVSGIPEWLRDNFTDCDIERFSIDSETTSGIMDLHLPRDRRVALTVLKKIYNQAGSGRKEEALPRGLDMASRELLQDVIGRLVSMGWIEEKRGSRGRILYVAVKGKRKDALKALESPASFQF
ncbi:NACHT domain-containing protein [Actinomadura logoneensis]|uniref:NACHT domain-containing protein n=1 Tax=Actinomadura logoneensis TaxID=2293572 RepID=A0A372JA01_9ACTN|nr:NACHT domain-containing protein [Actinomadura logoneensis]RFU36841.1 NACHT domain-containing protein [Actinomadura logoneensis]